MRWTDSVPEDHLTLTVAGACHSMIRVLIAVAAVWIASVAPSHAQNNSLDRNERWREQAISYLDRQHAYEGFVADPNYEDWVMPLDNRLFRGSERAERVFNLEAGVQYKIVGACDSDCTDLDMSATDDTGAMVAEDISLDDRPVLNIRPITTGRFTVKVWWAACSAFPCYAGVRVLRQSGHTAPNRRIGGASGTGFLVTSEGHLVTNNHVIEGARRVYVQVGSERVEAQIIARDPANDLAVLQADVPGTPLPVRSASRIRRGEEVFTLGFPLVSMQGENQKASFGRINATSGLADDVRYLQIDAPIQPGNSGGPLLNNRGEVIGVVTATLSQGAVIRSSGTLAQNVNYAVKADYLLPLIPAEMAELSTDAEPGVLAETVARVERSVFRIVTE